MAEQMKVGIAADHGGYEMKQKIHILLAAGGHQVVDFGNLLYDRAMIIPTLPSGLLAQSQPESWNAVSCFAVAV
jgi:ribose 5-phosphate isomerase RpiB